MSKQAIEKFALVCGLALIVILAGTSYILYQRSTGPVAVSSPELASANLVARVSKLMLLPTGETPTIATVSDPATLKDQPFFANAQTGDKVLIYTAAKKAILYSVNQNIILEVAPLNLGSAPAAAAAK